MVRRGCTLARSRARLPVWPALDEIGGSISAEHGIDLQTRDFLAFSRSAAEIGLMRQLKAALDPKHILNPGKIFEADAEP